jgi:hypothetical protein
MAIVPKIWMWNGDFYPELRFFFFTSVIYEIHVETRRWISPHRLSWDGTAGVE